MCFACRLLLPDVRCRKSALLFVKPAQTVSCLNTRCKPESGRAGTYYVVKLNLLQRRVKTADLEKMTKNEAILRAKLPLSERGGKFNLTTKLLL